jgi:hypothetical protein
MLVLCAARFGVEQAYSNQASNKLTRIRRRQACSNQAPAVPSATNLNVHDDSINMPKISHIRHVPRDVAVKTTHAQQVVSIISQQGSIQVSDKISSDARCPNATFCHLLFHQASLQGNHVSRGAALDLLFLKIGTASA